METSDNTQQSQNNEQRIKELEEQLQRALADYANLKKRFEKEKSEVVKFSNEMLLMNLINIVDGFDMILKEFNNLLAANDFEKLDVEVGSTFDPNTMEATDKQEEGNKVTLVYAPAYKLHDKIVRPAKVQVGK